jgi:hypothetical protein
VFLADNGTNFLGGDNVLGEKKVTKKDMKNKHPMISQRRKGNKT